MQTQIYERINTEGASSQSWQSQEREEEAERETESGEIESSPQGGSGTKEKRTQPNKELGIGQRGEWVTQFHGDREFKKYHPEGYKYPIFDLRDLRVNMLTVLFKTDKPYSGNRNRWTCKCDCGKIVDIRSGRLMDGAAKSCGCSTLDFRAIAKTIHGGVGTPTYQTWASIRGRCVVTSKGRLRHSNRYSGRGITMCERWANGEDGKDGYTCFLEDMGEKPDGMSIDRIDNDGNYEPSNCRWATQKQQARNKSTNNYFEWNGTMMTLPEICELGGVFEKMARARMDSGWTLIDAIKAPKQPRKKHKSYERISN